nr:hypothetical protein [Tanacetum cinerariifolium]
MGLLDFVKYSDPFKVRTEERTLASSEVPLLAETADMVVNSCAQSIRLVTHTITNEINTHAGKNKRKVGFSNATPPVKKVRTEEGVRVNEHVTTDGNLFLSFRSSLLRVVRPVVVPHVPFVHEDAEIMTTGPANETHDSSDVTNDARMDNPVMCRNLVDHVPPPRYHAFLCNLNDADFFDRLNLNLTQQICMVFELRL